jgi:hypothetical protein
MHTTIQMSAMQAQEIHLAQFQPDAKPKAKPKVVIIQMVEDETRSVLSGDDKSKFTNLVNAMMYLSKDEQKSLLNFLLKHQNLFNGTFGHWYDSAYNIEL